MNFCSICTGRIDTGAKCHVCQAQFHSTCWNKWMKHGKGCPNCRHCVQHELLINLIPDIPPEVCDSLTSLETYNLCKIAIMLTVFKGLAGGDGRIECLGSVR